MVPGPRQDLLPRTRRLTLNGRKIILKRYSWKDEIVTVTVNGDTRTIELFGVLELQTKHLCWLFVIADLLESLYRKRYGLDIKISKQELLDKCKPEAEAFEPYSFCFTKALDWIEENGVSLQSNYPMFTGVKRRWPARRVPNAPLLRLEGERFFADGDEEGMILRTLNRVHLVAKLLFLQSEYTRLKEDRSAIYTVNEAAYVARTEQFSHGVLLIAWDTDEDSGINYYIVRDPNQRKAPNRGIYKVKRYSSVGVGELNPIVYVTGIPSVSLAGNAP